MNPRILNFFAPSVVKDYFLKLLSFSPLIFFFKKLSEKLCDAFLLGSFLILDILEFLEWFFV